MGAEDANKKVYVVYEEIKNGTGNFIQIFDDKKKAFERFIKLLSENWDKWPHADDVDDDGNTMANCINLKKCNIESYYLEMVEAEMNHTKGVEV